MDHQPLMLSILLIVIEDLGPGFYKFITIFFSYIVFMKFRIDETSPQTPTKIGSRY